MCISTICACPVRETPASDAPYLANQHDQLNLDHSVGMYVHMYVHMFQGWWPSSVARHPSLVKPRSAVPAIIMAFLFLRVCDGWPSVLLQSIACVRSTLIYVHRARHERSDIKCRQSTWPTDLRLTAKRGNFTSRTIFLAFEGEPHSVQSRATNVPSCKHGYVSRLYRAVCIVLI